MHIVFLLSLILAVWGPLIPYVHCLVVPVAYAFLIWISHLYLEEITLELKKAGAKQAASIAWLYSWLVPLAVQIIYTATYFARVPIGFYKIGLFIIPAVLAWLIEKIPHGTLLLKEK